MSRTTLVDKSVIGKVLLGTIWCILSAGPIFGFSALKPILGSQGFYSKYCSDEDLNNSVICDKQERKLNRLYVYCATCYYASFIIASTVVDKCGARVSALMGSLLLFVGSLAISVDHAALLTFGMVAFTIGGPFIYYSTLHISTAWKNHAGIILSIFLAATDTSSGVFSIYRYVYEHVYKYSVGQFFSLYAIVPVFILVTQLAVQPNFRYKSIGSVMKLAEGNKNNTQVDADESETTRLLPPEEDSTDNDDMEIDFTSAYRPTAATDAESSLNTVHRDPTEKSGVFGALHDANLSNQVASWWFVLIVAFTIVQMIIINSFIATNYNQNLYILDSAVHATRLSRFFDMALPLGGLTGLFYITAVLDNIPTVAVFSICTVASCVVALLSLVPIAFFAQLRMTILALYRPFFYASVTDYCVKVFGFDSYSIVVGLIMLLGGVGNLFNLYFDWATHKLLKMNPVPINMLFAVLSAVIGSLFLIHIARQTRYIRRKQLENEARYAPVQYMPGAQPQATENECNNNDGCESCVCRV